MIDLQYTIDFIKEAHGKQLRKYTGEPYYIHPIEVMIEVSQVQHTKEMLHAALMHDVLEDTEFKEDYIRQIWGNEIARIVCGLTDQSRKEDGNRKVRKAIDREWLSKGDYCIQTIKLADLINNSYSITEYDKDFAVVYMKEKEPLLDVLINGNTILMDKAKEIIKNYNIKRKLNII